MKKTLTLHTQTEIHLKSTVKINPARNRSYQIPSVNINKFSLFIQARNYERRNRSANDFNIFQVLERYGIIVRNLLKWSTVELKSFDNTID